MWILYVTWYDKVLQLASYIYKKYKSYDLY